MTIADGILTWEVVNTRNVDNVGIEIDYRKERNSHNRTICEYLKSKEDYEACLMPIIQQQFEIEDKKRLKPKPLSKRDAFKLLIGRGNDVPKMSSNSKQELNNMLRNDLKRYRIIRALNADR